MNIIKSIKNYFLSAYAEMRKVVWPSRKQTINNTLIVIISVIVAVIIFGLIDLGLSSTVEYLLSR